MTIQEQALAIWQSNNCSRCYFADAKKVGTGEPCCTRLLGPEPKGAICLAREDLDSRETMRIERGLSETMFINPETD